MSRMSRSNSFLSSSSHGAESLPLHGGAAARGNLSIASNGSSTPRKSPLKTMSCTVPRPRLPSAPSGSFLPDYVSDSSGTKQPPPPRRRNTSLRAAEGGSKELLPTKSSDSLTESMGINATGRKPSPRRRNTSFRAAESGRNELLPTKSSESLAETMGIRGNSGGGLVNTVSQSLRSRRRPSGRISSTSDDESVCSQSPGMTGGRMALQTIDQGWKSPETSVPSAARTLDSSSHRSTRTVESGWSEPSYPTKKRMRPKLGKRSKSLNNLMRSHRSYWMQMVIFLVVTCLVFDSYNKAVTTTERLDNFKEEESILMMHLQKIEKQSINLHENLSRLNDMSGGIDPSQVRGKQQLKKKTGVDSELIRVQTQQLYQMEEELEHELRALQTKLQAVARGNIIRAYGEGPVQVVFELDIPGEEEHNTISILLWYDTPHAAWAWLQEIQKGIWNGSSFTFGKTGFSVDSVPTEPDRNSKLDFVEKSQKTHEPWTVGLTELEGGGGLRMFINLQDNSGYHKHDVCVGKIIDGFDALQRLVSKTRQLEGSGRSVTIKKATAAHLTRSQSAGLI